MREEAQPDPALAVQAASTSTGQALPAPLQHKFEASLGADLSGVRVHTGDSSVRAAEAVSARAYAQGQDIHFGAGEYSPQSGSGERLLAHEVAHTVQQSQGGAQRAQRAPLAGSAEGAVEVSPPDDPCEHEADQAAEAMVAGQKTRVGSAGAAVARAAIQRDPDPKAKEKEEQHQAAVKQQWAQVLGDFIGGNVYDLIKNEITPEALSGHAKTAADALAGEIGKLAKDLAAKGTKDEALKALAGQLTPRLSEDLKKVAGQWIKSPAGQRFFQGLSKLVEKNPEQVAVSAVALALAAAAVAYLTNLDPPMLDKTFSIKGADVNLGIDLGKLQSFSVDAFKASVKVPAGEIAASMKGSTGTASGQANIKVSENVTIPVKGTMIIDTKGGEGKVGLETGIKTPGMSATGGVTVGMRHQSLTAYGNVLLGGKGSPFMVKGSYDLITNEIILGSTFQTGFNNWKLSMGADYHYPGNVPGKAGQTPGDRFKLEMGAVYKQQVEFKVIASDKAIMFGLSVPAFN